MLGGNRRVSRRTARRVSRRRGMMDTNSNDNYESSPSEADQLSELASLRDEGVLTDEEFEAKKRKILGI